MGNQCINRTCAVNRLIPGHPQPPPQHRQETGKPPRVGGTIARARLPATAPKAPPLPRPRSPLRPPTRRQCSTCVGPPTLSPTCVRACVRWVQKGRPRDGGALGGVGKSPLRRAPSVLLLLAGIKSTIWYRGKNAKAV